jgi:hypothetical protein
MIVPRSTLVLLVSLITEPTVRVPTIGAVTVSVKPEIVPEKVVEPVGEGQ